MASRATILAVGLLISIVSMGQRIELLRMQESFKDELLKKYKALRATPEEHAQLNEIKNLPFFPFDSTFRVHAILDTLTSSGFLPMKTSRGRNVLYRRFGVLSFSLSGRQFSMPVYQGRAEANAGSDELFFPFTDDTNGASTYGGGRYIDLRIPKGSNVILDFNKAYNPYCAYSHSYSCEIPPDENKFSIRIEAGLKY